MADSSTNLGLPFLAPAQAQKHVTLNEALLALDSLVQLAVLSRNQTAPPADPADGDRYLIAANATGDWTGSDGRIAAFQDGIWNYWTPREGWLAWIADEGHLTAYTGNGWQDFRISTGLSSAEVIMDFGNGGARAEMIELDMAGAMPGDRVTATPSLAMPAGLSADELEMDMLAAAASVIAPGRVRLCAASLGAPVTGKRRFTIILASQGGN